MRSSSVEVTLLVLLERHFLTFVSLFLSRSSDPLWHAGKKISSHLQHASLSLVRFQEYTIIHPARGAEEDTWAGEAATSKNTVWAPSFHSCPFWDGENSLLLPHFTQGQSQDVGSLLFYTDAFAVFPVLL